MKCPYCKKSIKNPVSVAGGKVGGLAKVAKGFAVINQPTAEARARGWETRRSKQKTTNGAPV